MIAGRDFPDYFVEDRFLNRRSGLDFKAGNPWDPASLLTGAEARQGFTYRNSARDWPSYAAYRAAVCGQVGVDEVLRCAPRIFTSHQKEAA